MYSISNLVIAIFIGGGIGGALGWYLALNTRSENKRKVIMDLQSELEQAKQGRSDYEAEVSEHFSQTADLLQRLTCDYRAVYTHLAEGAEHLCGDRVNILEETLASSEGRVVDQPQLLETAQPLDYAPKKPDEKGQLSETFGLDKSNRSVP